MHKLKIYLFMVHFVRKFPFLQSLAWKCRIKYHALRYSLFVGRPIVDGGPLLEAAILNKIPYAAGKLGSTEAAGAVTYLKRRKTGGHGKQAQSYPAYIFHTLYVNSGVYPQNEEFYDRFYQFYLDAVSRCDALVSWNVAGEVEVFREFNAKTQMIQLPSIEPYFSQCVWTRALKGKKVLVISPFSESVKKQYKKHEELWDIPDLLPSFELITLRAPLSAGLVPPQFPTWFDALGQLTAAMDQIDYDVALIGAGAYSLPLAAHAKKNGKVGVHLGGNLQFLFGIYGKRWEAIPAFHKFIKSNWIRPDGEERPANVQINESGCYW